jgi:hypothetical protein
MPRPIPEPEPVEPSASGIGALLKRQSGNLTIAAVAVVLILGVVVIRTYWRRMQAGGARQELVRVKALQPEAQRQALERLAQQYAGCEVAPEIRYRLGCAYHEAGLMSQAETTLHQLEQDVPGTPWAQWASDLCRQIARDRSSEDRVAERIRILKDESKAQRAFIGNANPEDIRNAALPAPCRPETGPAAPGDDPRSCNTLEKP